MPDSDQIDERITGLEETIAHQALAIDELSTQLAAQWKTIDQLQVAYRHLMERFQVIEETGLEAPANTRPPHY